MSIDLTHYRGLSAAQAASSLAQHGANVLYEKQKKRWWSYVREVFEEPMLLLLLITAVVYFLLNNALDGMLMVVGVLLMIGIDLYQEAKTDKALEALKEMSAPMVTTIRDGKLRSMPADRLVVGDFIVVQEGDRVAGDAVILESANLSVDESMLTGESGPVHKGVGVGQRKEERGKRKGSDVRDSRFSAQGGYASGVEIRDSDESHLIYAGTLVLTGQAVAQVIKTGVATRYGAIGKKLAQVQTRPSPLQRKTARLVKLFGFLGLLACLAIAGITYAHDGNLMASLLIGLTLAISVIPEELPVVLTVFSAIGAYRLTKRQALVRDINIIESLGEITTLCTDKTGTLTENRITLQEAVFNGGRLDAKELLNRGKEYAPEMTLALYSTDPRAYDPMDLSLQSVAAHAGLEATELLPASHHVKEYGFDHKLKCLGHAWRKNGGELLAVKGAAENVLTMCALDDKRLADLGQTVVDMSAKGLRVLAVGVKKFPSAEGLPETLDGIKDLEFVALLGFNDPPRSDARAVVQACKQAGIAVRLITGDHPDTARFVARAVGLPHHQYVMTGPELDLLDDAELAKKTKGCFVYARIVPEQKVRIVEALRSSGEIVAMVGDGVNDGPSLKEADVGVAMGARGTNVAREASDLVLLDDRLATVTQAVNDGRKIFDNIQKAVSYIFTVHVYVILLAITFPLFGLPPVLLPIHIVLLELIIDPTCAIVFEAIPAETDIMRRKPRDPERPIISRRRYLRIITLGITIFAVSGGAYLLALRHGLDINTARTLAFSAILWCNVTLVFTSISRTRNLIQSLRFLTNKSFVTIYSVLIVSFLLMLYVPGLNRAFGFAALPLTLLGVSMLLGLAPVAVNETWKFFGTRRTNG